MSGLGFLWPVWWPFVAIGMPLLGWLGLHVVRHRRARRTALWPRRERALLGAPVGDRLRGTCGALAWAAVGLALLQPVAGLAAGEAAGPDLVVCLDVSRSMLARDVAPHRLGAAQRELQAMAAQARGARCGLVVYAGTATLAVPLCSDLPAVAAIAAGMDPTAVARGGTDLGAAIDAACAALQRGAARAGSVVVLSDGEDFVGHGAAAAARARAAGLQVHCLGFGTAAGSKVVVDTAAGEVFLRDGNGQDVITALAMGGLEAVAAAGDGIARSGPSAGLVDLYGAVLAPRAEAAALADPGREPAHRFQWPLLLALLLWMLRGVIPERRR